MDIIATPAAAPVVTDYVKNFHSNPRPDYNKTWTISPEAEAKVENLHKEVRKMNADLAEKQNQINNLYSKMYATNYTPTGLQLLLEYTTRAGSKLYFSYPSGQLRDKEAMDPETYVVFPVETKAGDRDIVVGYCYEYGGLITKKIRYSINPSNDLCRYTNCGETFEGFLEDVKVDSPTAVSSSGKTGYYYSHRRPLAYMKGSEFVNTLFGTSRNLGKLSLEDLKRYYKCNKSFEIILKTAPDDMLIDMLQTNYDIAAPVHKLLGLDKHMYEEAQKKGIVKEVYELNWAIQNKAVFNRTQSEWFDLIDKGKKYLKDLEFYGINTDIRSWKFSRKHDDRYNPLLSGLAMYYDQYPVLNKNYSFGKFIDYIVKEVIDQAYSSLDAYVSTLVDYLRMCEEQRIKPTLYSSQLDLTHNIAKRNSKINVTPESEDIFKLKYAGFTPWKNKGYMIIAPEDTHAVKVEGDQLDHCVASYIKRVIDGECLIYFLREKPDESLITIEIENGGIVQARGVHNRFPNDVEIMMLNKFAKDRGLKCCYNDVEDTDDGEEDEE